MTTTTTKLKHTPGTLRAAEAIALLPFAAKTTEDLADIIGRETAAPALRASHDRLWKELDRLAGEVQACWGMDEPQLRRELGNTNYQAVADRLVTAKAALTEAPA